MADEHDPVVVATVDTTGGKLPERAYAETPGTATPNVIVQVVGPALAIFIRFINTYLTTLVGLVAAGMTSDIIPASDFVSLVWKCAQLSIAGAGLGLLKDLVTIFGKLETKYPLWTGNV